MTSETILFLGTIMLLLLFIAYGFYNDRKYSISDDEIWRHVFEQLGGNIYIPDLSHDEDQWFYKGVPTCVGYGDWKHGECPDHKVTCFRDNKYGYPLEQATIVISAIKNGGQDKECPLIYIGAN